MLGAPPPQAAVPATFDKLDWVYRPGAEGLLRGVSARAWAQPAAQGWKLVKRNPRREVWRAEIDGHPYYLKYYTLSGWQAWLSQWLRRPACLEEWDGGLFAEQAGIPAVMPVAYTLRLVRDNRPCALLVTHAIEPAVPLNDFWRQLHSDTDERRRRRDTGHLIDLLGALIARAHQAGFEHLDLHAANILVQPLAPRQYRTLFVDLHSARRNVPLTDRAVVRNLAQLNQWFHKNSSVGDRLRFVRAYLRWRDAYELNSTHGRQLTLDFDGLVMALAAEGRKHAHELGQQRDRRARRDGTYFATLRFEQGWRAVAMVRCKHPTEDSRASHLLCDRDWWQQHLTNPLRWFQPDPDGNGACKDSHSAFVRRAVLPHPTQPIPIIVKRPKARNLRRRIIQWLPPSRSLRGWRRAYALLHRDIPTARPLAVLERRIGPLVLDNILVTEAVPGALDLETHVRRTHAELRPLAWAAHKRALAAVIVRQLRRLEERGFYHRDCKANNILVVTQPQLAMLWIDMDGLRHVGRLTLRQRLRPLVRLYVSLSELPGITRTDLLRFLRLFCARFGAPDDGWRKLVPLIDAAAQAKLQQRAARQAWKKDNYGRQ